MIIVMANNHNRLVIMIIVMIVVVDASIIAGWKLLKSRKIIKTNIVKLIFINIYHMMIITKRIITIIVN